MIQARRRALRPHAFTLTELLVVIIIILILVSVLIPTVSKVLNTARETRTKAFIAQLEGGIEAYHLDFRAYPGPFPNNMIANANATATNIVSSTSYPGGFHTVATAAGYDVTDVAPAKITAGENLLLGLIGGLRIDTTGPTLRYDPSQVGQGPSDLGVGPANRHSPYLVVNVDSVTSFRKTTAGLLSGHFTDEAGAADDTSIPEFVDGFPNPLPVLYLRAKVGASVPSGVTRDYKTNSIVTYDSSETDATLAVSRLGQYDLHQIIGYTSTMIGVGKSLPEVCADGTGTMVNWKNKPAYHGLTKSMNGMTIPTVLSVNQVNQTNNEQYFFPYDAYAYFRNASQSSPGLDKKYGNADDIEVPRQKDGYILISAGKDRVYGTDDDITNFGAVSQ